MCMMPDLVCVGCGDAIWLMMETYNVCTQPLRTCVRQNFSLSIHKTMIVNETKTMVKVLRGISFGYVLSIAWLLMIHSISVSSVEQAATAANHNSPVKFIHIHAPNGNYRNQVCGKRSVQYIRNDQNEIFLHLFLASFFCVSSPV